MQSCWLVMLLFNTLFRAQNNSSVPKTSELAHCPHTDFSLIQLDSILTKMESPIVNDSE